MPALKINTFSGIRPRVPESMLPESAATIAQNCDFAYGELRNTKGGFFFNTMANLAASIYTDDGLTFYSWESDVNAVRSPLVSDTFNRLYYSTTGGVYVTNRLGTRFNGGPPSTPYLVGVPRPATAPILEVKALKKIDVSTANMTWKFHYEYGGVKYQEASVSMTTLGSDRYRFTPPTKSEDTPEGAFPVVRLTATWLADGEQACDLYSANSGLESTKGYYSIDLAADDGQTTFVATVTAKLDEAEKEARVYVYTYVNTYGEEGPPSPVAAVNTGTLVPVDVTVSKPADGSYAPIKEIRIYRTPTGSELASYFYVGSLQVLGNPPGLTNFTDDVKPELLNEELASLNNYAPDTGLRGLMSLPNGILCAWKGNELHFSEPYKPWAWPPAYVKPLPNSIVGGISHGAGAVITTTTVPYMVSGVSSDSMTVTRLNVDQAGVSKWSIAVVDGVVVYASNDGLVALTGGSGTLVLSQQFFTREVWRQRYASGLASMRFAVWDGRLVVYSSDAAFTPFMIRLDEAEGSMTELPGFLASCHFVSPISDQFYYVRLQNVYQFQGGSDESAIWVSREIVLDRPLNFGIAKALVTGSWTVQLYAYVGGVYSLRHTETLTTGEKQFRLPAGYESDRYRISITGAGRFRELRIAQSARELATV